MASFSVFDIIKLTPKNNCGDCNYATCMAFAVAVVSGNVSIKACPHIDQSVVESMGIFKEQPAPAASPDSMLLKELKSKILDTDFQGIAEDLGARLVRDGDGTDALEIYYLGRTVTVSASNISSQDGLELDPRDQILLYNYIFFGGKGELSGEWVGLESFPNSISKVSTLKRYTEDRLSERFGTDIDSLPALAKKFGARDVSACYADICIEVPVLPKLPLQIHLWGAEPDEGFEAKAKVLYDKKAIDFLDLESLVFAAERLVEEIIAVEDKNQ